MTLRLLKPEGLGSAPSEATPSGGARAAFPDRQALATDGGALVELVGRGRDSSAIVDGATAERDRPERGLARTSIVLADSEALMRTALARLLPMDNAIEVIAEAGDGREAVMVTLREKPDVLVIELDLRGIDGLDAVVAVRQNRPQQAVLLLTRHATPAVLRRALQLGVQGFVSKSAAPDQVAMAIGFLKDGKSWIDPEVSARAIIDDCPLTNRELDALRLTGEGYSIADIASMLFLADGTVRNYLSSSIGKTQARSRHEAARFARTNGWL